MSSFREIWWAGFERSSARAPAEPDRHRRVGAGRRCRLGAEAIGEALDEPEVVDVALRIPLPS